MVAIMQNTKATLTEIAQVFGVSTVTVSNALNKRKNVSADKAEAICKYARKIGYQPSLLAKSLLKGKTNIIGFILKQSPVDSWYSAILNRLQEKLWNQGYHLSMFIASDNSKRLIDGVNFLARLNVDALVVGPMGFLDEYQAIHPYIGAFNYVMAFDSVEHLPIDSVKPDAYQAAQMAVDHLVENGHKQIGMLGYELKEHSLLDLKTRYSGFTDSLSRYGLPFNKNWMIPQAEGYQLDIEKFMALVESGDLPTAFFCHSDNIAAHTMKILAERGYRIPDDISFIGVNDMPIAELMHPGITTISFELEDYVDKIIQLLMNNIKSKTKNTSVFRNAVRLIEKPRLVARGSVKNLNNLT